MPRRSAPLLLAALAACGGAAPPGGKARPVEIQFAFFHFHDERVEVSVDGRAVFDRTLTVAPQNTDYGIADFARIELPPCSDIVVKTPKERVAQRLCLTPTTRALRIDGGPPLKITAQDGLEGID